MGRKNSLTCSACEYSTVSSAGPDAGFSSVTNTFICKNCKVLVDLWIKTDKSTGTNDTKIGEGQNCRKCGKNEFELWDSKKKECPKCGGTMVIELGRTTIHWD